MSHVTSLTLIYFDDEDGRMLVDANSWLVEKYDPLMAPMADVTEHAGGNKVMQCSVALGAFNHFPLDAFIEHLRTIDWGDYGATLVVWDEHDVQPQPPIVLARQSR